MLRIKDTKLFVYYKTVHLVNYNKIVKDKNLAGI